MADTDGIDLGALRDGIDDIDRRILELLNRRAEMALRVAEVKLEEAGDVPPVFYRPERESQVLRRMMAENPGPLSGEKVAQVYRQIMSACLALEEPLRVAYLGPEGTFTQLATLKQFGDSVVGAPLVTVDDVFREVESETCHYGVVPVENSTEGVLTHTLDNFLSSSLRICGEVELRVHHTLMKGQNTQEVTRVYAHQQALGQCRMWLDRHYPNVPRIAVASNAAAAQRARDEVGVASIAAEIAADIYDLSIIARKIEDQSDNTTRFLVVGREQVGVSGKDKTSIMVSTRNKPGALYKLLEPFHRHEVSLTKIETRPSRTGMWSYVFFIDFEGHEDDATIVEVLSEIDRDALEIKMLGSYPRAIAS